MMGPGEPRKPTLHIVANDVSPPSPTTLSETSNVVHVTSAASDIPAELERLKSRATAIARRDARQPGPDGVVDLDRARALKEGTIVPSPEHFQEAAAQELYVEQVKPPREEVVAAMRERAKQPRAPSGSTATVAAKEESTFLKNLTTEQKVHGGLWMLSAALSAVFAWSSAKEISTTDEKGQRHISASAVGLTLVQGLFAAGSVYLGVQAMRGR